jgi:hypothetical protein
VGEIRQIVLAHQLPVDLVDFVEKDIDLGEEDSVEGKGIVAGFLLVQVLRMEMVVVAAEEQSLGSFLDLGTLQTAEVVLLVEIVVAQDPLVLGIVVQEFVGFVLQTIVEVASVGLVVQDIELCLLLPLNQAVAGLLEELLEVQGLVACKLLQEIGLFLHPLLLLQRPAFLGQLRFLLEWNLVARQHNRLRQHLH